MICRCNSWALCRGFIDSRKYPLKKRNISCNIMHKEGNVCRDEKTGQKN